MNEVGKVRWVAEDGWLELADVVRALRRELVAATTEGEGSTLRFQLGPVELEFLVDIRREAGADAGVRFGVVSFGGRGTVTSGSTHRVKLVLMPQDASGRPAHVSSAGRDVPER